MSQYITRPTEAECKHNSVFFCQDVGETYAMFCVYRCGFSLNFHPEFAGKIQESPAPKNPLHDEWKLHTICFLDIPSPNRDWKKAPTMAVEGTKMKRE